MRDEIEEIEVETAKGTAFVVLSKVPGMQAGKLLVKLTGIIGPGIAGLGVALKGKDGAAASKAAAMLADRMSPEEFETTTLLLLKGARARVGDGFVDLNKHGIDQLFEGCSEGLFKLVFAALKGNYLSFFSVAESQIKAALKTWAKPEAVIPSKEASQIQTPPEESSGLANG